MQPILRVVIPNGLLRLMAVGDVNIRKTVVVKVKRTAAPRPTRASNGFTERRLFKPAVGSRQIKPVPESHPRTHGAILGPVRTPRAKMLQPVNGGRIHADH